MISRQFRGFFKQSCSETSQSPLFRIGPEVPPQMEVAHLLVMIVRRGWTILPKKHGRSIVSSDVNLLRHAKGIVSYAPIVITHPGGRDCQSDGNGTSYSHHHLCLLSCEGSNGQCCEQNQSHNAAFVRSTDDQHRHAQHH